MVTEDYAVALNPEENMCFACSPRNPIGLKLSFEEEDGVVRAVFVVRPEHQGWPGYLHGGLIATLCDEAMAQWLWRRGVEAYTGELAVRFKKGVPVGAVLEVRAELVEVRRKMAILGATVLFLDGAVAATATGKFICATTPDVATQKETVKVK